MPYSLLPTIDGGSTGSATSVSIGVVVEVRLVADAIGEFSRVEFSVIARRCLQGPILELAAKRGSWSDIVAFVFSKCGLELSFGQLNREYVRSNGWKSKFKGAAPFLFPAARV